MTPADRKVLWTAGGLSVALTALGLVLSPGALDSSDEPTTYSIGSGGARAAYELLVSSGYSVARWEDSPARLADAGAAIWVLAEPEGTPTREERQAIVRFIERGGRVIATGLSGALFLPDHDVAPDPLNTAWKRLSAATPSYVARQAPQITLAPRAFWSPEPIAVPLYADEKVRVAKYNRGLGDAYWWASATPLTNAGLREPGNLEFFLASLGGPPRHVLWDEYFHGHRRQTSSSVLTIPALAWTVAHLLLLVAAVLVTHSRRSGPIMVPPRESRLSPLEFVRTLGELYQRAGAASVAVDIAWQRLRYALGRRLGQPPNATVEDLVRILRDRGISDDPALAELLRSCERARRDPALQPETALVLTRALAEQAAKLGLRNGSV